MIFPATFQPQPDFRIGIYHTPPSGPRGPATLFWRACGVPPWSFASDQPALPITAPWATKRSRFWGQNFESPKRFKLQNMYQVYHPKPELVWTEPSCIHYFTSNTGRQIHALQGLPMVSQDFTSFFAKQFPYRPLRTAAWHVTCRSLPRSMHFASPQFIGKSQQKMICGNILR